MTYNLKQKVTIDTFVNTKWKLEKGQGKSLIDTAMFYGAIPEDGHDIASNSRMVFFGGPMEYPGCSVIYDREVFDKQPQPESKFEDYFEKQVVDETEKLGYDSNKVFLCDLDGDSLCIFKKDFTNPMESPTMYIKLTKKELKEFEKLKIKTNTYQYGRYKVESNGDIIQTAESKGVVTDKDYNDLTEAVKKSEELKK